MNNNQNSKRRSCKYRQSPKQPPRKRPKPFTYKIRRVVRKPRHNRLILTHIAGINTGNIERNKLGGN